MKKFFPVVVLVGVVGVAGYWVIQKPADSKAINEADTNSSAVVDENATNLAPPPQLVKAQSESKPVVLSPEELTAVKAKASQMQLELSGLTAELDKNLENNIERKKIEEEYRLLTQEYNKLVLQIVKAAANSVEIAKK